MKRIIISLASFSLLLLAWGSTASAKDPGYECDNNFGDCGTPNQSGGGGGGGGGSILVNRTDRGDTYQFADDYDDDGVEDNSDNCPRVSNIGQADGDGDKVGNACDNCLNAPNKAQSNIDGDAMGDACDGDIDGDKIKNAVDNCAKIPNPKLNGSQPDLDGDNMGDACDEDIDGDGKDNLVDKCPANAQITNPSSGQQSKCFPDKDGDQVPDVKDVCPRIYDPQQPNLDGDEFGNKCDPDIDNDKFQNVRDNCPSVANKLQVDGDRDGMGNACDAKFCYVVMGDKDNCLDPEGPLNVYSPKIVGKTGEDIRLRLFANRRNQPMRYHWTLKSAPEGSQALLNNRKGTVTVSTPFEYHYLESEEPTFVPDKPGEYEFRVTAESVWEDRVSGKVNESASYTTKVNVDGEPVTPHNPQAGCSATADDKPLGAMWLAAFGLAGLFLRRRRD